MRSRKFLDSQLLLGRPTSRVDCRVFVAVLVMVAQVLSSPVRCPCLTRISCPRALLRLDAVNRTCLLL